ncbi:MAG: hypothetical protein Q9163_001544 [Psora crenata]
MKAILQRVASASVSVDNHLVSSIGKGVLVFAAVGEKDTLKEVEAMASKVLKMKMWSDESGVKDVKLIEFLRQWKKSVQDIKGEVLCVSQFTLMASTKKGNKPDFHDAAGLEQARELYDHFYASVQALYDPSKVKNGVFQAMMEVNLQNSGPVSVNYTSLHEAVTLEIETSTPKGQEKDRAQEMKDAKDEKGNKTAEHFELSTDLLE